MDTLVPIFGTLQKLYKEGAFLCSPGPQEYSGDYFDGVRQVQCDNR